MKFESRFTSRYQSRFSSRFAGLDSVFRSAPASAGVTAFTPASLFTSSEEGAWYDPSDLSTLFQDSAGTTPVTADGQPVGLMLDKRLGLDRGADEASISGFTSVSTSAGFSATSQNIYTGSKAVFFEISFETLGLTSGLRVRLQIDTDSDDVATTFLTSDGVYTYRFQYNGSGLFRLSTSETEIGTIEVFNISVREIPGNHATQATAAARPLYKTSPSRLVDDGVDDALNWIAPADDYTIARVNSAGTVTILTAQALSGATDILLETNTAGYVAIDRALTSAETTSLTAYLEGLV